CAAAAWRARVPGQSRSPRVDLKSQASQALLLVTLALPMFFSIVAFVIDGSTLMVHKRSTQNAADAVALAIAQNINLSTGTCNGGCNALAQNYLDKNGIDITKLDPPWHQGCNDPDPTNPTDTNCWNYPYVSRSNPVPDPTRVEVRVREKVHTFFTGAMDALLP